MGQVKPEVFDYSKLCNGIETCLVMAVSRNGVIGKDNTLPWNFPEDLARFKDITSGDGKAVLMGYNTWLSLPVGKTTEEKLAGRKKFVLTSKADMLEPMKNTIFIDRWATNKLTQIAALGVSQLLIIGGAKIFETMLYDADRAYVTVIDEDYEGDAMFELSWIHNHMHLLTKEQLGTSGKLEFRTYIHPKYVRHTQDENVTFGTSSIRW